MKKIIVILLSLAVLSSCGKKEEPVPLPPPPPQVPNNPGGFGGVGGFNCGNIGGGLPLSPNNLGYVGTLTSANYSYGYNGGAQNTNSLTLQIFHANQNFRYEDPVQSIVASGMFTYPSLYELYPYPMSQPNTPTSFCVSSSSFSGGTPVTGIYLSQYASIELTLQGLAQIPLMSPFGYGYQQGLQMSSTPITLNIQGYLSYGRIIGQVEVMVGSGSYAVRQYFYSE